MNPSIVIDDVSHSFGPIHVLDQVSFEVPRGVIFGLLGPSGSGKTTLIRLIAGALKTRTGDILVNGRKMPDRQAALKIGYMTQSAALYTDLTLRENLEFFGTLYGLRGEQLSRRVEEIARAVELSERLDSQLITYSGGMVQRASLACALLHDPDVLMLDEPTVGLDPVLRRTFWDHFRTLAGQGKTLIVSSHIMDEADRCDVLGFIREGRLLITGSPDEIRGLAETRTLEDAFLHFAGSHSAESGVTA